MIRRVCRRSLTSPRLPWAPPALTAPRMVTISADPATRLIELGAGEDCLIAAPEPIAFVPGGFVQESTDAMVTVVGGRNVVWLGAKFVSEPGPVTTVEAAISGTATTLTVASTAGFPPSGVLRVDGEGIAYSSKTATTFTVTSRSFGFYLGSTPADLSHAVGAKVYLGEYSRTAVSFRSQTGFVHAEGFDCAGFLNDGVRVRGSSATTVTLQNIRIGPVSGHEAVSMTDGHPDCIQTWGSGVKRLRVSHATLMVGKSGRGLINAADTSGGGAVESIDIRDAEIVDANFVANALVTNSTPATVWNIGNCWLRSDKPRATAIPDLGLVGQFDVDHVRSAGPDFVPAGTVGLGYVSPGYR